MPLVTTYQDSWPDDFIKICSYLKFGICSYESIEHIGRPQFQAWWRMAVGIRLKSS